MAVGNHTQPRRAEDKDFIALSRHIRRIASLGVPRVEFLLAISRLLLNFSECDALELRVRGAVPYRWTIARFPEEHYDFDSLPDQIAEGPASHHNGMSPGVGSSTEAILHGESVEPVSCMTRRGSFYTCNLAELAATKLAPGALPAGCDDKVASLLIIPFEVDEESGGELKLAAAREGLFPDHVIESYEAVAQTLGLAIADHRAQAALRERIKELTCLYRISQVKLSVDDSFEDRLRAIVHLLPPAWQYPDSAAARIVLDNREYATGDFVAVRCRQSADILVKDERRGFIEVAYIGERLECAEQPFLTEEKSLLQAIAREVSLFVEQVEAKGQREQLEGQLRHADRLATIGQLTAGIAHEINEPLGGILGFAQLLKKSPRLPTELARDIEKIIAGALTVREIIRKLMLFARQAPPLLTGVNLNTTITDSVSLLAATCLEARVEVVYELASSLPEIEADSIQIQQVLVNLIVNALQAMPDGGTLTITTRAEPDAVRLTVKDTGVGMSANVRKHAFDPFFTTKEVGKGTGLGLSVVQGVVAAHGGTIEVESDVGGGAAVEIRFTRLSHDRAAMNQKPNG